jgi:hypothetical protein
MSWTVIDRRDLLLKLMFYPLVGYVLNTQEGAVVIFST